MSEHDEMTARPEERPIGVEPSLIVGNQYLKSSSIASFGVPEVFLTLPPRPHIGLRIDVNARQLAEERPNFEVSLILQATGYRNAPVPGAAEPDMLYRVEMVYAGIFAIQNAATDAIESLLLIEAPRLLFPSMRHFLMDLIREAGFPVTNIQPVDFRALRQTQRAQG